MASYTPNLDLLKKNPLTEGSDTFDITTMLNDNWDKIDAKIGNSGELWVWEKKNASTLAHIGYVVSPSSTTYPEDGQQGDYWYTRLGQIGDGMTRIETGSYVGTGTYGASNPNSLNVPFTPKLMFLAETTKGITVIAVNGMSSALEYGSTNTPEYSLIFTSWGTTVSWYSSSSAAQQGNQNNRTYTYVFIG